MQYLLTQEEYDKLGPKSETAKYRKDADELAMLLAAKSGHGCFRTTRGGEDSYCSDCPSENHCPHKYKAYGK